VTSDWRPGDAVWRGHIEGQESAAQITPLVNGYRISHAGIVVGSVVYTRREAELAVLMPEKALSGRSSKMRCPIPGVVVAVHVSAGVQIKAGDSIAIVEAMKMQNVLRAERDGVVKVLHVNPGDSLSVDAVILEFV
jgi:propionyl-CoA carboxylase alpha chain